ncbi:MAG: alpha/beta hydrolase [Acidobacteriaceae bacterium]|jgi:alpha/beta superfamily hydrolase|nr:alpha/beta hydrolase [Acidobacteriaceae bacterium]
MTALREIPGPAGRLETLLDEPRRDAGVSPDGLVHHGVVTGIRAAVVFGHPHPQFGGTMHTKATYQAAKALARIGCAVLRFNFRGCGLSDGSFDEGVGERADFIAALDFMHARYPEVPLWAAGMSFGSWVGLTAGAHDPRVSLLLGVAAPVNKYDYSAVAASEKPKFFIHGERDEICSLHEIREFYSRAAEPKELAVIDAADHLFGGKVSEVADAVEDLLGDWNA